MVLINLSMDLTMISGWIIPFKVRHILLMVQSLTILIVGNERWCKLCCRRYQYCCTAI